MKLRFDEQGNCVAVNTGQLDIPFFYDAPDGYNPNLGGYRLDGVIRNYSPEQAQEKSRTDLPDGYVWSNITMSWQDTRSLETIKQIKWQEIKTARAKAETDPLLVNARIYDADPTSQAKISGAVQLASLLGPAYTVDWTLADNTTATLSATDITAVGIALGTRTASIYEKARRLREQIDQANTKEQVEEIKWL